MRIIALGVFFLFSLPVPGQETPDCRQFKAALYTQVVILLEVQKEFDRASEDHESAFEEYHQCSSDCSQLEKNLVVATDILLEKQLKLEQASEDHRSAFEEYHKCQGTWPVSDEEEEAS